MKMINITYSKNSIVIKNMIYKKFVLNWAFLFKKFESFSMKWSVLSLMSQGRPLNNLAAES